MKLKNLDSTQLRIECEYVLFCPFNTSLILASEKNIQCEVIWCCARM